MRSHGLLLLLFCADLSSASAQGGPLSQGDLAGFIANKMSRDRILAISRRQCLSFVLDEQSQRPLLLESGDTTLIAGLHDACYMGSAIEISADRPGVIAKLDEHMVGAAPWSGPVAARDHISVAVQQGNWSQRVSVDVRPNRYVRVLFHVPEDTLAVPEVRSAVQMAQLADTTSYTPSTPRPVAPAASGGRTTLGGTIIGGLIGAAGAAGIGYTTCRTNTVTYRSDPAHPQFTVQSGSSSSANFGCAAGIGGGGLAVGGLVGNLIARAQYAGTLRRYEARHNQYVADSTQWQQGTTLDSLRSVAEKRRQYHQAQADAARAQQIIALNAAVRKHNAALSGPEVMVESARRLATASLPLVTPSTH